MSVCQKTDIFVHDLPADFNFLKCCIYHLWRVYITLFCTVSSVAFKAISFGNK